MIMDGGMEEIGWRYLLQPTLEKQFSYFIATVITAFIWWAWHLPMFFIPGSG
ncbi:CPBP family intramembrane glutamic endopeptidase [Kineothrix sp. MB12-C1]|uniref:CPBP family intramembrane glutamic endopeptidase n=1 Tax=Kineothrix sp. MB12-C1 TaxID=3070215 RepID=UPI003FA5D04F